MVDTFYRSRKNLTPSARLYLQKVRLSQKRRITAISGLELINPQYFTLNSVKNRVGNWGRRIWHIVASSPTDPTPQACRYSIPISTKKESLVQLFRTFTAGTPLTTSAESNHSYSLHVTKAINKNFYPITATLWNSLPWRWFSGHFNLNLFKSRSNYHYLSSCT